MVLCSKNVKKYKLMLVIRVLAILSSKIQLFNVVLEIFLVFCDDRFT